MTSQKISKDEEREHILDLIEAWAEKAHRRPDFDSDLSAVPASGRVYESKDVRTLADAALDFWLTSGRFNDSFEKSLAKYMGLKHALTVNSGSSALLASIGGLTSPWFKDKALSPGDEVITAASGFPTTINPILLYQMVPVFVDMHIPTYNIDPVQVEAAITSRTRAIVLAHTLGNPFDLQIIMDLAKKYNLWVIEDCCDALGSRYDGKLVGTFGDAATFSFYPAHHITMGEGGAVVTNSGKVRRAVESMRDWGRDCYCGPGIENTCGKRYGWQLGDLPLGYDHKYIYSNVGFNLKITDMQAAAGLAQFSHLADFVKARRHNFKLLHEGLSRFEDVLLLPEETPNSEPSWFGFPIIVRENSLFERLDIVRFLNSKRIATRLLFGGNLTRQPFMSGRTYRAAGNLVNADRIMNQCFWIGVYPGLDSTAISYVLDCINEFIVEGSRIS